MGSLGPVVAGVCIHRSETNAERGGRTSCRRRRDRRGIGKRAFARAGREVDEDPVRHIDRRHPAVSRIGRQRIEYHGTTT